MPWNRNLRLRAIPRADSMPLAANSPFITQMALPANQPSMAATAPEPKYAAIITGIA